MGDDRQRGLLGLDRVAAGQRQADARRVEQAEDLLVLGLVRAGRVAPRVAPALAGIDPQLAAHLGVQPFGHALGHLHAQAVHVELLGELALLLEASHQVRDLAAGGDGLDRDHVALAAVQRAVEVGQADAVVRGLAREDQPLQLALAVLGVEHDQLVALGRDREVAQQRARLEVVLLAPHARQARWNSSRAASPTPRPSRRGRPSGA